MKTFKLSRSVTMILGAALAMPAFADVGFDFGGYFRAGPQASDKNSNRTCYGLTGAEFKYRLGNECEGYGEFLLTGTVKQATGEVFKVFFMPAVSSTSAGSEANSDVSTAQMYTEISGLDFAPGASFWGGKRYHRGADVHIVDKFFEQLDGTGAGATIDAMGGKLDLAYYRKDGTGAAGAQVPGNRLNAWLRDIPVNPDGTLNVLLNYTKGDADTGKSGTAVSVRHTQSKLMGGNVNNNLWLQMSQGSAGLTGNFGDLTAGSDVKKWRIVDGIQGQLSTNVGFQAIAMYQSNKADAGDSTITSLGGRLSYAFTRNFKLLTDLGIDRVKPANGSSANLTKLTIAPTISTGPGFFNRPELRFYVTTAKWNDGANDAAKAAAGNATTGLNGVDSKTSGTSYGVQAEVWF
jgi:maltoporin